MELRVRACGKWIGAAVRHSQFARIHTDFDFEFLFQKLVVYWEFSCVMDRNTQVNLDTHLNFNTQLNVGLFVPVFLWLSELSSSLQSYLLCCCVVFSVLRIVHLMLPGNWNLHRHGEGP